jgi:hypothetical protein
MDMKEPTGIANKTSPRPDSDKPKFCWMVGIREAQLAKHSPCKKKRAAVVIRNVSLE